MLFDEIIGNNIKNLRMKHGLSLKQLAARLSEPVALQQMQKYEKGTNRVAAQRLHEFSQILDCPIMAFYEGIKLFETELWDYIRFSHLQNQNVIIAATNLIEIMKENKK